MKKCNFCGVKFITWREVYKHAREEHPKLIQEEKKGFKLSNGKYARKGSILSLFNILKCELRQDYADLEKLISPQNSGDPQSDPSASPLLPD